MRQAQTRHIDRTDGIVALDWGTSSLRAWRLAGSGAILDARREDWGIMHLPEGGFEAAFAAITRGWSVPGGRVPAIACGMVGSRQGWREAPYVRTPAGLADLASGLLSLQVSAGQTLHLVPGVLEAGDAQAPDVMRGEETQAIGAMRQFGGDALLVMPGTHSKWARLRNGRLTGFRTMMTGELFALLCRHSILGRGQPEAPEADPEAQADAFRRGVCAAWRHGAFTRLFSTRALGLTGGLAPGCATDYLSGLLIGEELRGFAAEIETAGRIALTGDAALCARYCRAFAAIDADEPERIADTALEGLVRIAARAGLLPDVAQDGVA